MGEIGKTYKILIGTHYHLRNRTGLKDNGEIDLNEVRSHPAQDKSQWRAPVYMAVNFCFP
jgi:hypothetical protein